MTQPRLRMRLGDLLVAERIISAEQLELALQQQRQHGRKLGATLIELDFIGEEQLLMFLAQQLDIPFFDLTKLTIQPQAVQLIPEAYARRYRALAVHMTADLVTVALSDPADLAALDALAQRVQPRQIKLAVARESQLLEFFDKLYRRTREIETFAEQLHNEFESSALDFGPVDAITNESDATVVKLLRSLFEDAVQMRASDIHIEPDEKVLRIRQRIDGTLQENVLNETRIAQALVLRLKLVAGLDISEKRLPQDGRFNIKVRGHDIDVRMSTMPVQHGESVVMRLLDQSAGLLTLEQTGMPPDILTRFRRQLQRPHGMILVTGPTGSGKTTLLASGCRMLIERPQGSGKLLTYEAPIEYTYDTITRPRSLVAQSEIPRHLPTFAAGVRNALRRKPNIILVGEARDRETVSAAIEAGQTGHLVYSTVHTVGVAATIRRMVSVFEPAERTERAFALMETLRMVVTQALVPKVGGGRIGLREYLVFEDNVREQLLDMPIDKWTMETQRLLVRHGRTMEQSANEAFKAELIDRRTYLLLTKGFTVNEEDMQGFDPVDGGNKKMTAQDMMDAAHEMDLSSFEDDDTSMI